MILIPVTAARAVDREFVYIEMGNPSPPEKKPNASESAIKTLAQTHRRISLLRSVKMDWASTEEVEQYGGWIPSFFLVFLVFSLFFLGFSLFFVENISILLKNINWF